MSPSVDRPRERVLIETPRYRIEGEFMLPPPEGYRSRLSDFLNDESREFLIVLNTRMSRLDAPDEITEAAVMMLHRSHINLIIPRDT